MQPAWNYPTGKTGPYHLTGSGATRPLYQDGALYCADGQADNVANTAAELMAFVDGDDTPMTMMVVMQSNSDPFAGIDHHGIQWTAGNQFRLTYQSPQDSINAVRYGNGGVGLVQMNSSGSCDTDKHVWLVRFDGAYMTVFNEDGTFLGPTAADVGSLVMTTLKLVLSGGKAWEMAIWARSLTAEEITNAIRGAAARQSVPFPSDLRYRIHDYLYDGTIVLADDSAVSQLAPEALATKRAEAISYLWGGELPTGVPTVTEDVDPGTDPVLNGYSPSSCAQIDRLDLEKLVTLTDESTVTAHLVAFHYHPSSPSGKCIYVSHGHGHFTQGVGGLSNMIQAALTAGHGVVCGHMVCERDPYDSNTEPEWDDPPSAGHVWLGNNAVRASYIGVHLELPIACMNLLSSYSNFAIVGLSGGGWTAAAVAALDQRFSACYPIAGTAPMWLRMDGSSGDVEQKEHYWYELFPYPHQYQAACSGGRRLRFVCNEEDNCCFGPNQYSQLWPRNQGLDFEAAMDDLLAQLTNVGCDAAWWFDHVATTHMISTWAAAAVMADLEEYWS
jgi:hypothetical protein